MEDQVEEDQGLTTPNSELSQQKCLLRSVNYVAPISEESLKGKTYKEILLVRKNADELVGRFMLESSQLRRSDAFRRSFTMNESIERMIKGYNMLMFDYYNARVVKVFVVADAYGVIVKRPMRLARRMPYIYFGGIIVGGFSSTLNMFKEKGGNLNTLGLEITDCITLIGKIHNFDFASPSDTAKYDFIQVVSYYVASSSIQSSPCIPLSKAKISVYKVKIKVQQMAKERLLSLKELFLVRFIQLAILKVLLLYGRDSPSIRKSINKICSNEGILCRVANILKELDIKHNKNHTEQFNDLYRATFLSRRIATFLDENLKKQYRMMGSVYAYKNITNLHSLSKILPLRKKCFK